MCCCVVLWFGLRLALFVSVLAGNKIGAEGAGRLAEPLGGDRRMQPPSGGRRDLVLALAAPANSIQSLT